MLPYLPRILLIALVSASCCAQTVYRSEDAQGHPVYSDQPPPGAKAVELPPVNTTPGLRTEGQPQQQAAPEFKYTKIALEVTNPVPNGLAPVTVGIVIEPQLRPGDSWVLSLDGKHVAQGAGGSYTFQQLERGQHQLQLNVLSAGSVIGSASESVFVYWPGKHR